MDIGSVPELFQVVAARNRGEQISEFKIAGLFVDSMWLDITKMFASGMSKTEIVGMLMITARISRTAAYNTLTNKLNCEANRKKKTESKPKSKPEVSVRDPIQKMESKPEPVAVKVEKVVAPSEEKAESKPEPVAVKVEKRVVTNEAASTPIKEVEATTSACAESSKETNNSDDKWAHLRGKKIIVGKGFLGEEKHWMTPEEIQADKDRRAAIEKVSIASGKLNRHGGSK